MIESELQKELQREIEINIEKDKLEEIKNIIKEEINEYVAKRKEIAEYIKEYRKENLEEYRNDEDKVAEYFDHERFVKEELFKFLDRRLRELIILESSPYFGKVIFKDQYSEENGETIYIGRFGLSRNNGNDELIIDWRAPVCALFYAGKLGQLSYIAPNGKIDAEIIAKRQFIIKKGSLLGMFDSALDVKDDILQMVLSRNASEKLKDIIMTIQAEQDNIIRQPKNMTVVVNGTAGSGKTTIALHRVAYLLYNYRDTLQDKVLILGPNSIFMEYIKAVLPSLGEVGVRQMTFAEFVMDVTGLNHVMSLKEYMEKIFIGDKNFIEDIIFKNSDDYVDKLDNLIDNMDKEYFKSRDILFYDITVVDKLEIDNMLREYFKDMPLFKRSKRIKKVIFSKLKDARDTKVREIQKQYNDALKMLSEEEMNLKATNLSYIRKTKIREVIREVINVKEGMKWLDNPDIIEIYKGFSGQTEFTQDDLAPMLYIKLKLEGYKLPYEVKHVVIDEAQDYSKLQFRVIKEITRCQSMTIVGDSNQRLIPIKGVVPMAELDSSISDNIKKFALNKSYRSTQEIMEYANKFLKDKNIVPLVRNGEKVVAENISSKEELTDKLVKTIKTLDEKGYESIAVICRNLDETRKVAAGIKTKIHVNMVDEEDILYHGGIIVIPSYFAKGMEFDAVLIVDMEANQEIQNDKMMYVMATRALHELYVFSASQGLLA